MMGRLAADPGTRLQCDGNLPVCDLPPAKRKALMDLLQNYRLNIFNEDFQAFYRLRPYPLPAVAMPAQPSPGPTSTVPGHQVDVVGTEVVVATSGDDTKQSFHSK